MREPITIVSGFGRCGSSLVMQMLEAGGMHVTGEWPAFEHGAGSVYGPLLTGDEKAMAAFAGKAVKILDPKGGLLPTGFEYRVIWCARDYDEQAKSQVKFLRLMLGIQAGRDDASRFARSYRADRAEAMQALRAAGTRQMLTVWFEETLAAPESAARKLAAFCDLPDTAIATMASAVRPRSAACAPGFDMEIALMESRA